MPSKPKAANDLHTLVAKHGLKPFLDSTRTLVVLLNSQCKPVSSNAAFGPFKKTQSGSSAMKDYVAASAQTEFDRLLQDAKQSNQPTRGKLDLDLGDQHRVEYDCLFIPLEDDRLLFFAEPGSSEAVIQEKYRQLLETLSKTKDELQRTRLELEIKQTEVQAVKAQADEVSHVDSLTYLPNRKQIVADLQREVMYSERYGTPLSVTMIDLDHFKLVNDTYGHSAGDDVLRFVAMQFREHIRLPDMIGRYGGEEFLVVLPNSTVKAASEQAARLCQHMRSTPVISGAHTINVTISIGIAQYRIHGDDWHKLIDRADQALYQAKNNGRDQWAITW